MRTEFLFCKIKRVVKMDGGNDCTAVCIYLMIPLYHMLKNG